MNKSKTDINIEIGEISVLLPTYMREKMVHKCILNIANQSLHPKELIVLDQGQMNRIKLEKFWDSLSTPTKLKYLKIDYPGKSNAVNIGVEKANSDLIAVIDDDCIADVDWILVLTKSVSNSKMTIFTGKVNAGNTESDALPVRDIDIKEKTTIYKKGRFITPIFIFSGGNFCFKKDDFYRIGVFNISFGPGAKFKSAEDVEWSYRAMSMGYFVKYIPDAIVEHRSWRNEEQDLVVMEKYGYGAGAFFKTMLKQSKLDFLFHFSNITRWLLWESIKCLFMLKDARPYSSYVKNFIFALRSNTN